VGAKSVEIVVNWNHLPQVPPKLRAATASALNVGIMATIGYADPLTPVDTGLLKGNKDITLATPGSLQAALAWLQFYAIFQEMGTSRGVPARHFAQGGVDAARPALLAAMTAVGAKLA
jgi:hypothetical protein